MRLKCAVVTAFVLAFLTLAAAGEVLAPLKLELPYPVTCRHFHRYKLPPHMESSENRKRIRPPFLAPEGTRVVSRNKPVTSGDSEPIVGELDMVTDGDKRGSAACYVELGPHQQWVQIDLEEVHAIHAILLWHYHGEGRVYHDVVVQIADDAAFKTNVRTVFNNDYDNSSGLGQGKDKEYFESYRGRLMPVKGLKARYVRLYSNGSTTNDLNYYTEIEVWGK